MTKDDIIRMAKEAGFECYPAEIYVGEYECTDEIERFAAPVAAAEREECAKVCDDQTAALEQAREELIRENDFSELSRIGLGASIFQCKWLSLTIRARGQS